jgi:nucleoside-diphosphate-sugar epimerase
MHGKTVLVTGASGFLGGALARRLADEGAQVRAFARSAESAAYLQGHPNITPLNGDITDAQSVRRAVYGCTFVFHSAVSYGDLATQRAVNVEGTRIAAEESARAGVERFVHVSSIATYGYHVTGDITEATPLKSPRVDPYGITKIDAERMVERVDQQRGLAYSIIRPGMIYGERSGMWTRQLFQFAQRRPTPFIGRGLGSAHPIHVDDVVDLCLTLATRSAAYHQAFNCAPDPAPTWRDWLTLMQQLAGHRQWLPIPPLLVEIPAQIVAWVAPAGSRLKDAGSVVGYLRSTVTYKMDKARRLLGWQPQVDLATGVERSAGWLRESGLLS